MSTDAKLLVVISLNVAIAGILAWWAFSAHKLATPATVEAAK